MSATDHIEGTAVEEPEPARAEVVHVPAPAPEAIRPARAEDLADRLELIKRAMELAMKPGVDYGVIPNTDKPSLLKPGAEKLAALFRFDIEPENEKRWGPDDHLTVISRVTIFDAATGNRLGSGEGMCSTREKKYGKRKQERVCPACGVAAVIKGKAEYGGGWLCWKKRDGCGAKFAEGDQAIESQPVGEIDNPDLPDQWNTVLKMAKKRGMIDAVLSVTGASALFTQDMEDMQPGGEAPSAAAAGASMGTTPASAAQKAAIRRQFTQYGMKWADIKAVFARANVPVATDDPRALVDGLAKHEASALLDLLKEGAVPTGGSDVPSDASGFEREEVTPEQIAEAFQATELGADE